MIGPRTSGVPARGPGGRLAALVTAACLGAIVSGCAGYTVRLDGTGDGYDVYKPEPYLLLVAGPKGHTASVIWLPDYGTRYRVDTWNVLSKADFGFIMEDGWRLTRVSDKSDTTAIPDALVKAMEEARKSDVIPLADEPIQLFKFIYGPHGNVLGLSKLKLDLLIDNHKPPAVPE